jgi:hypothetical protein
MKASIRAREANTLDVAGIMESTGLAIRAGIPIVAEEREEIGERPHIPPFKVYFCLLIIQADAEKPEDVYNIEDIAPLELLLRLPVQAFLRCKDKTGLLALCDKKSAFIVERLVPALHSKDEEKVKRLVYLLYLIQFFKMSPYGVKNALEGKKKFCPVPKFLIKHFADMFMEKSIDVETGKEKLLMSEISKDKNMNYILVLALIESGSYRITDVTLLAGDLGISKRKCTAGFKEVGCKVEGKGKNAGFILALPLSFPKKTRA